MRTQIVETFLDIACDVTRRICGGRRNIPEIDRFYESRLQWLIPMLVSDGRFSDSTNCVCISRIANIDGGVVGTEASRRHDPRKKGCYASVRSQLIIFWGAHRELVYIQNNSVVPHGDNSKW